MKKLLLAGLLSSLSLCQCDTAGVSFDDYFSDMPDESNYACERSLGSDDSPYQMEDADWRFFELKRREQEQVFGKNIFSNEVMEECFSCADDEIDPESNVALIRRYLFCLSYKSMFLGKYALEDTPADLKELHFIAAGELIPDVLVLSEEEIVQDMVRFNEVVRGSKLEMTPFEREKMGQNAMSQLEKERTSILMWEYITGSQG